jgi:hypothetical protein
MSNLILFEDKKVRRVWHNERWYFSIIDIIFVLTDTENARRYWSDLKRKLKKEGFNELYDFIVQLKMQSSDGKKVVTKENYKSFSEGKKRKKLKGDKE